MKLSNAEWFAALVPTVLLLLNLSGCDSTEYEQKNKELNKQSVAQIQSKLPEGCTMTYLGTYVTEESRDYIKTVMVTCQDLTTLSSQYKSGKQTVNTVTAQMDKLDKNLKQLKEQREKLEAVLSKLSEEDKKLLGL
jgi:uncharacterized phage infection (PIP) family protein YhgE